MKATLLKNARLMDEDGVLKTAHILIKGSRIAEVFFGDCEVDAVVTDLSGYTVTPGFIQAHVHLMDAYDGFNDDNLKNWLLAGVTTLRDEGILSRHTAQDAVRWREECAKNPMRPSLCVCGAYIAAPDGYGGLSPLEVTNEAEARDGVKRQLDAGVDHIKIALEDGFDPSSFGLPKLPFGLLAAICDEAHRRGSTVSAHVTQRKNLQTLVDAGIDDAAHMCYESIPDDLLAAMVRNGVSIVPTLTLYGEIATMGFPFLGAVLDNTRRFVEMGGNIALGNDHIGSRMPWYPVGIPYVEIELLRKAGLTARQVVDAATVGGSKVLGREDIGRLKKGCVADIIAVRGDPYDLPLLLTAVPFVMKQGVIVKHET